MVAFGVVCGWIAILYPIFAPLFAPTPKTPLEFVRGRTIGDVQHSEPSPPFWNPDKRLKFWFEDCNATLEFFPSWGVFIGKKWNILPSSYQNMIGKQITGWEIDKRWGCSESQPDCCDTGIFCKQVIIKLYDPVKKDHSWFEYESLATIDLTYPSGYSPKWTVRVCVIENNRILME